MSSASDSASGRDALPAGLAAASFRSEYRPEVSYTLERAIGRGGFAHAVLAQRHAPEGSFPVVLKVMRPEVVFESGDIVTRLFKKEVVALGRLNERVPPTPFVVRLLDTGSTHVQHEGRSVGLPWLAVEYVPGGIEGETLSKRVRYAVAKTGYAFDPPRVAALLEQLVAALTEIHAARITHRDLKPGNVLCCGFGASEVVKVSDFGIARPSGVLSTFGDIALGSPGYVAPEQIHLRDEIGPTTDVFSLAAIVFFMLTGQRYFDVKSAIDGVLATTQPGRRRLAECATVSPELAARPGTCRAVDDVLARATAADPRHRPQSAADFGAALAAALDEFPPSGQPSERLTASVLSVRTERITGRDPARWRWMPRHPGGARVMVDVAWESDGHCLAATLDGLSFWDGVGWSDLARPLGSPVHMVRRLGAGRWLLSLDGCRLQALGAGKMDELLSCPELGGNITAFSGNLTELCVLVISRGGAPPLLAALRGGRWREPLALPAVTTISGLAQLERERWLVTGRRDAGGGYAALFRPVEGRLEELDSGAAAAWVSAAGLPERGVAIATGGAHVLRVGPRGGHPLALGGGTSWSACGLDLDGGAWLAGAGVVWYAPAEGAAWSECWRDSRWTAPFVSVHAETDRVILVTADGGVLEGRASGA
ncbi:MAG: serine/threonine protein kinase [Polyangiaceae bacterium]|nr:serine/threonine protein kinase [Polyangiaceae bacterium]